MKLKNLVHYIISLDKENRLGKTKLNKTLFYIDLMSFYKSRMTISGLEYYVRMPHGMCPPNMDSILEKLENEKKIKIEINNYPFSTSFHTLDESKGKDFTEENKLIIKSILEKTIEYSAAEISEINHDDIWHMTTNGELVPFHAYLVNIDYEKNVDMEWVKKSVEEYIQYSVQCK